jgi:hypothetical protein
VSCHAFVLLHAVLHDRMTPGPKENSLPAVDPDRWRVDIDRGRIEFGGRAIDF